MNSPFDIVNILHCLKRNEYGCKLYPQEPMTCKPSSQFAITSPSWLDCKQNEEDPAIDPDFNTRDKKPRTCFTKRQIAALEEKFLVKKYLSALERSLMAGELGMTDSQVKTWFQNRRTKWRRQEAEERARGLQSRHLSNTKAMH